MLELKIVSIGVTVIGGMIALFLGTLDKSNEKKKNTRRILFITSLCIILIGGLVSTVLDISMTNLQKTRLMWNKMLNHELQGIYLIYVVKRELQVDSLSDIISRMPVWISDGHEVEFLKISRGLEKDPTVKIPGLRLTSGNPVTRMTHRKDNGYDTTVTNPTLMISDSPCSFQKVNKNEDADNFTIEGKSRQKYQIKYGMFILGFLAPNDTVWGVGGSLPWPLAGLDKDIRALEDLSRISLSINFPTEIDLSNMDVVHLVFKTGASESFGIDLLRLKRYYTIYHGVKEQRAGLGAPNVLTALEDEFIRKNCFWSFLDF